MKRITFSAVAVFAAAVFILLPLSVSAKDEWLQVRSKNFHLIGNASEKDIRKVASKLEQFRETFRQLFGQTNLNASIPTNVVVFKSDSAYKPFKPKRGDGKIDNFVAGYFQPGDDVNYITLSSGGDDADTYGTIFHEYVHFVVNTTFGKSDVPPWFNEGLAEYYQTFVIEEDQKVKLGLPQSNHLALLQENKLIPLDSLFKTTNYALHQNANHSRSIFYAQSWALIHYLVQSGKTEGLDKFLKLSMANVPAEKAFQDAFQIGYAQMEKELAKYIGKRTYQYNLVTFKNKMLFDTEMKVTALSEAESNAYLGDLLFHINRKDDAEPYLQTAVALMPNLSMANTTLGMVKLSQRKYDEAKGFLEKAISGDQKNHLAFYRYAYLLSRDGRDEFGYVTSFPADQSSKMREMLNKAIALNPTFTESYELLAFVNMVNNEKLDEAVLYLQKALKYQPGNQRYMMRVAEIYIRQNKFDEALAIADKTAMTTGEPEIKAQAEKFVSQIKQMREMFARNEASRKQYEEASAEMKKNGGRPVMIRRGAAVKEPTPEELVKADEEATLLGINQALRKLEGDEQQVLANIQKIDCGKSIVYSVKTDTETFTLSSKDFQALILTSYAENTDNAELGCGANVSSIRMLLTYKPHKDAKNINRGELVAVEFVPANFRFITAGPPDEVFIAVESAPAADEPPPAVIAPSPAGVVEDFDTQRRAAMMLSIKNAMRPLQAGEKRSLGFIEKSECTGKGSFFFFRTPTQIIKLSNPNPQELQIRAFTQDVENVQFGCGMKQLEVPVVFTYLEKPNTKSKTAGDLVSLEFVPTTFVLER